MKNSSSTCTLHDLPAEERPRERLIKVGVGNLSLQELLALLIEKGGRNRNALQVAQNLLSAFGNLQSIKSASLQELKEIKGIGPATACKLMAAFALGEKALEANSQPGQKINSAADVHHLLKRDIGRLKKEHFKLLSLDSRSHLIGIDDVSIGTLDTNLVHPREVFRSAISRCASFVILSHNHPSGDPAPSEDDLKITRRLVEVGKIVGIRVHDHVIVAAERWFSFKERGLL